MTTTKSPTPAATAPAIDAVIERRLTLDAPPERVWRALTEPEGIAAWFSDRAAVDLRPGGDGWFEWDEHGRIAMRVEEVAEEERLVWRWARRRDTPLDEGPSTRVEWRLSPAPGGGTVLELTESGFQREEDRQENVGGWQHELAELVAHLGG